MYSAPGSGNSCCIGDTTQEGMTTDMFAKVATLVPNKMLIGSVSVLAGAHCYSSRTLLPLIRESAKLCSVIRISFIRLGNTR